MRNTRMTSSSHSSHTSSGSGEGDGCAAEAEELALLVELVDGLSRPEPSPRSIGSTISLRGRALQQLTALDDKNNSNNNKLLTKC